MRTSVRGVCDLRSGIRGGTLSRKCATRIDKDPMKLGVHPHAVLLRATGGLELRPSSARMLVPTVIQLCHGAPLPCDRRCSRHRLAWTETALLGLIHRVRVAQAATHAKLQAVSLTDRPTRAPEVRSAQIPRLLFPSLVVTFVMCIVISNITATKGVVLFSALSFHAGPIRVDGLVTDGAFWLFPLSYVIGDVISEVYGFRAMRTVVAVGFVASLASALAFKVAISLPQASFYEHQEALQSVVGAVPQILAASLAGFVAGELLNSYVLVTMKARTGERGLWSRLMTSTVVGEFADTTIFCLIAASAIGINTGSDLVNYIVVGFVWKTLCEASVLPISTTFIKFAKRYEPSYFASVPA